VKGANSIKRFLFQIRIKPGRTIEEYADIWARGSQIIQKMPGARGTRLHCAIGDPDMLLTVADWESTEARDSAMAELNADEETSAFLRLHLEVGDFIAVGEYDDAEWTVLP
jgi:hypothetical protein